MIELLGLVWATLGSFFRSRKRLILENLLLRQQLQVTIEFRARHPCDRILDLLIGRVRPPQAATTIDGQQLLFDELVQPVNKRWNGTSPDAYCEATGKAGGAGGQPEWFVR